jgi:hypothetical protein
MNEELAAVWTNPGDLTPWADNPRINDSAVDAVASSISRFGFASPIVARVGGQVIAGHTRLKAAIRLGLDVVPVRYLDISDGDAAALALADNRTGEIADWDDEALSAVLRELADDGVGVGDLGWSDDDLKDLLSPAVIDPDGTEDDVPEIQAEVHSKAGEVYDLGPHRLVCGDCTDPAVWDVVLSGGNPSLVLTDPPYGLGDTDSTKNNYDVYEDTPENLRTLAALWLPLARGRSPAVVFTPGVTRQWFYPEPEWVMCWFYGAGQLRSPWGFNSWQPFLCYGKDPSLATGHGCRPDAVNLNAPANSAELDHPCPKPVKLWLWMLERLTFKTGTIVMDPFGGSGTTLIACAMTGRIARLIELDPRYCDVIRRRWTKWAKSHDIDPGDGALDG